MQSIPTRIAGVSIDKLAADIDRDGRSSSSHTRKLSRPNRWNDDRQRHKWRAKQVTVGHGLLSEPSFLTNDAVMRRYQCIGGEVFFVAVDLRRGSSTFSRWIGINLHAGDRRRLNVPSGVACGWICVSSDATLRFSVNRPVRNHAWQRLKWNDSDIGITWPIDPTSLVSAHQRGRRLSSFADRELPTFHNRREIQRPVSPKNHRRFVIHRDFTDQPAVIERIRKQLVVETSLTSELNEAVHTKPSSHIHDHSLRSKPLILVIGSSGQLGQDLCRHLKTVGTVIGACRTPDRNRSLPVPIEVDIGRPASLRQVIRQVKPQIIVNASGMTDIDRAEAEPRLAQLVNATAPSIMAEEAGRCGAAVVHFCTDMVFRGDGERPFSEADQPSPSCQYATTKWIGTEAIRSSGVPHLVMRSGWLYSTHGENYVRSIMDMSIYRNSLSLAHDHFGSPTSTDWLAEVTADILGRAQSHPGKWLAEHGGLYHCATLGYASRAEVGEQILADCRQQAMPVVLKKIHSVSLSDLPSLARRPANCRLDCTRITTQFGINLPRWQEQLTQKIDLMVGSIRAMRNWVA